VIGGGGREHGSKVALAIVENFHLYQLTG
jgi:hypothetical protein